jgi:hypothetical protein
MKKFVLPVCFAALIAIICILTISSKNKVKSVSPIPDPGNGFVLMELFTSQGCSSCPPADELLGRYALQQNGPVIPIAFHVDYWNRLGWKDSFSTAGYSDRQRMYATWFSSDGVYTPQVVLNGRKEMVGSEEEKIAAAVKDLLNEKPAAIITVTATKKENGKAKVSFNVSGNANNCVINAALVQNKVFTHIKAGENSGVKLTNYNVVRDFKTIAVTAGFVELQFPSGEADGYSVVIFLQEKTSGKIYAAIKSTL